MKAKISDQAAALLRTHHLHGRTYAFFAAVARTTPQPVTVLTSDPEDLTLLCGHSVEVVKA
ncbi:hypothetical protein [Streptomyces hirsutus]|uniref:hypothetical protein n=1 Tax=Streptomyces hirsutus TaxID=35620 RepID=UPI0036559738